MKMKMKMKMKTQCMKQKALDKPIKQNIKVKSSQVKSSQVKSSQVKSTNILIHQVEKSKEMEKQRNGKANKWKRNTKQRALDKA